MLSESLCPLGLVGVYDYRSNKCDFASDSTLILIINLRSQPMLLHVVSLVEVNSGPVQDVHD